MLQNILRPLLVFSLLFSSSLAVGQTSFVAFESGHVRPVALSPDGSQLFAVNTPDNTLEIFDVTGGGLSFAASVPVGLEPVSVAARTNDEVWVVNHLSDSISIVDVSGSVPIVIHTLLVGDEPRDIVFAGPGGNRAFITTAHRGQHRTHSSISGVFGGGNPADPRFTTPGIDRADVWVFDGTSLGTTIGGTPIDVLTFFSDTPRALATDGTTVYVAAFMSGNQTTVVNETLVNDGFGVNGAPGPDDNAAGNPAPEVGAIVKLIGSDWRDADNTNRNGAVPFDLPDNDVFAVNATTLAKGTVFSSVGTILFNMAINPVSGKVYVTNIDSPNEVLFEGPGDHGGSTVQGKLSLSRITILDPSGPTQDVQHLNQHINYSDLHTDPGANHAAINGQIQHSLATPLQPTVSSDGSTIYVPAFGSSKIGVFTRTELEDANFESNFDPTTQSADYLSTTGGGPTGLALDETNNRLYVATRFNNSIEVIELGSGTTSAVHVLHNPEPASVITGRPFLYDATTTSGNGEASCSSCHIFGDLDALAWNLGNPDDTTSTNNQPQPDPVLEFADPTVDFHPMKGPMTTQTLKGMSTHGALHWRGDRVDGFFGTDPCAQLGYSEANSTNAPCGESFSFLNFIVAFEGLIGHEGPLAFGQMIQFRDFMFDVQLPPNPVRNLDNSLTADQQLGSDKWFSCGAGGIECAPLDPNATDTVEDCDGCHTLDPLNGFFGTGGEQSFEGEPQHIKVPHIRNVYSKVGMFQSGGNQVRGTGILHDGSVDFVDTFLSAGVFSLTAGERDDLAEFVLAFPTDIAPIVGQQVTIGPGNFSVTDVNDRIALIDTRAGVTFESKFLGGVVVECDVVAKTVEGGVEKGYARQGGGLYLPDDNGPAISEATLRAKANPVGSAQTITYTAVPPGSGTRMGIDRDEDSLLNGVETNTGTFVDANDTGTNPALADTDGDGFDDDVEVAAATDPTNPLSFPGSPVCGDNILEAPEECDDGNTNDGDCCSSTCFFESAATVCRASAGICDIEETCTGSSDTCPTDGFESAATECRASADICDVAETCTGSGVSCPTDGFESGATECRPSADICDVAETCTGSGVSCPTDGFESAATECRSSTGVCDPAETCTGASASCPTDDLLDDVPCLDSDVCNGAEECVVGVCQPMTPLDCDDADACTADSCDEVTGCAHDPIVSPECGAQVPTSSEWGLALIVALLTSIGGILIGHRRNRRSI